MSAHRVFADLRFLGVLAVAYFLAGKLGLSLAFIHASASPVWPPTGIALAAMLVRGYGVWPAILLGAFAVNVTTTGSISTSLGIAVGNTLEGLVGAFLVNRFANGRNAFARPANIVKFAVLAGIVSTILSATIGVTSLFAGGYVSPDSYRSVWVTWWLGDLVGALMVAPLILLWSENPRLEWNPGQALEGATLFLCVLVAGGLVFGGLLPPGLNLAFFCPPLLLWPAFRFGQREAVTAAILLAGIAITGTLWGLGPFARQSANESLLLLQSFMAVSTLMAIAVAAVVEERRRFAAQLLHLAEHDPLTDFLTRRRFQEELGRQLAQARRYDTRGGVLFLDLDDFKSVNDRLGHLAGDKVLVELAKLLRGRLRESDIVARLGGDEFAILLPRTDSVQAQALAAQLLEAIRGQTIVVGDRAIRTTASIGIALFPEHGGTVDEVLSHADFAMYRAKEAGRNLLRVYAERRGLAEEPGGKAPR
jgi:diguanylate cyclase (GGDEF)-like protein